MLSGRTFALAALVLAATASSPASAVEGAEETEEPGATKEREKGTGLGLNIVKTTVEAMGGKIEVESEKGKGTRFTLLLPRSNPDEHAGDSDAH